MDIFMPCKPSLFIAQRGILVSNPFLLNRLARFLNILASLKRYLVFARKPQLLRYSCF